MNDQTSDSSAASPSPARGSLAIVFVTVLIDLLGFGIVLPLLPRYGEAFQATGFMLGMLMAAFSAMQFLFAPIWGNLSDRWGRRPILILGLVGSMVFYALFGYATSLGPGGSLFGLSVLTWLFVSRIGAGIAGATISTAQAYIADVTGAESRAKGMALIGAAFGVGFTLGPLIGAGFVSGAQAGHPPAAPGYIASIFSGLAMLWAIFRLPESLTLKNREQGTVRQRPGVQQLRRLGTAIQDPVLGPTLLASFLTILAFAQFESTLSLLTEHLGLGLSRNFLVFAYIGLVLTVAQGGVVRPLAARLREFRMAMIGVTLLALGLLLVGMTGVIQSLWVLLAVIPLTVFGFAFCNPSFQSILSLRAPADEQGEILGVGQSVAALARIAGPVIGLSLNPLGIALPYWSAAGVMVLAWLMTFSLRGRLHQLETAS